MGTITFLLVLSALVFFHELGHFSVARFLGVKVYDFSIGFGPKLFTKEFMGTKWSLSLFPLGGYVKMKGQEDLAPTKTNNDKDSYNRLTPLQRIFILVAGPGANFVLAFILYFIIAVSDHQVLSATVGKVMPNSPAAKAGLMKNDKIIKINDKQIVSWNDLGKVIKSTNQMLYITVKRDNKIKTLVMKAKLTDTQNMFKEHVKRKLIGIRPAPVAITVSYGFLDGLNNAYEQTAQASKMIFKGVQKLISGVVPSSEVGGVISIGKVISDASANGLLATLLIAALLSVNLGVLNLLPIPALDGGHIIFNLYEMITKRKPSDKVLIQLTIMGWIILLGLMILGVYNDINRFF